MTFPAGIHMELEAKTHAIATHFENPFAMDIPMMPVGIRFWCEPPQLPSRTNEAQIAWIGAQLASIKIPPGPPGSEYVGSFQLSAAATRAVIPKDGVQVFGTGMHMHHQGLRHRVKLIRDGIHIADVARTLGYDFNKQPAYHRNWRLLPGDALIIETVFARAESEVQGG